MNLLSSSSRLDRLFPTVAVVAVILLAAWMGFATGGFFTNDWAPALFIMAALMLLASTTGVFRYVRSRWYAAALGLFAAYTAWTAVSILWSPNRGDAWLGTGQTLLYLLAFWIAASLVAIGASRRWILAASALGPAVVAALTLSGLVPRIDELFENNRLIGTVGYYNGEAAFLLVPFWVAIYVAGSRRVNPFLRGGVLAGAVLCASLAVTTQSRGAMTALAVSLPIFFLLSGQRIRGFLALLPIAAALLVTFPGLNEVYLAFLNGGNPSAVLEQVISTVWLTAVGAGLYGLLWGFIDLYWKPPKTVVQTFGSLVLAGSLVLFVTGAAAMNERVDNPTTFIQQKWEAFKTDDRTGQETSRYLSASGQGRYTYWQVAWKDFASHPFLGVGTQNYEATYYQLREQATGWVRQPHMLPLEVLAERGIVGGILFFAFIATCVGAGLWKRFRYLGSEGKAQVGALSAAIAYWFVHSSADWFWQLPAITLPAVVYLGMLGAPWSRGEMVPLPWPLRAIGAGVAIIAVVAVTPLYVADRYLAQSQTAPNQRAALAAIERAHGFNPADPQLAQREAELALKVGDWSRAEGAYERTVQLNPYHYAPHKLLAMFYEKAGKPEKALSSYRRASTLNPLDEELDQAVSRLEEQDASVEGTLLLH